MFMTMCNWYENAIPRVCLLLFYVHACKVKNENVIFVEIKKELKSNKLMKRKVIFQP